MELIEKYKDDLEALNFICYLQKHTPSTDEEIEDAIVKFRKVFNLNEALGIMCGIYGFM